MTDHNTGPRRPQRRAFLGGVGLGLPAVLVASTLLEGCTPPPTKTGITGFQVKDFGAKGDGVTDDTAAFGRAFAAVSAYGGGVVYVPPGRYRVGKLFVPSGCVLTGAGTASWIQLLDNTNATFLPDWNSTAAGPNGWTGTSTVGCHGGTRYWTDAIPPVGGCY